MESALFARSNCIYLLGISENVQNDSKRRPERPVRACVLSVVEVSVEIWKSPERLRFHVWKFSNFGLANGAGVCALVGTLFGACLA